MRSPQPGRSLYSCRAALIGSKLLPRWWWSRTRTSRTRVTKSHIRNVSGTGSAWTQISKTCQRCHYGTQKQVAGATYLSLSLSEEEDHMGLWRWGEEWTPDGECWKKGGGGNGILSSMDSNSRNNKNSERKNSTRLELQRKELGKERKTAEGVKNPIEKKSRNQERGYTRELSEQMNGGWRRPCLYGIRGNLKGQKGAKNQGASIGMGGIIYAYAHKEWKGKVIAGLVSINQWSEPRLCRGWQRLLCGRLLLLLLLSLARSSSPAGGRKERGWVEVEARQGEEGGQQEETNQEKQEALDALSLADVWMYLTGWSSSDDCAPRLLPEIVTPFFTFFFFIISFRDKFAKEK